MDPVWLTKVTEISTKLDRAIVDLDRAQANQADIQDEVKAVVIECRGWAKLADEVREIQLWKARLGGIFAAAVFIGSMIGTVIAWIVTSYLRKAL